MTKPLTILFDASPVAIAGKSGVGHYTAYLVQALADAYPDDVRLVGHYYDFLGRGRPADLPTAHNISYRPSKLLPGRVVNMLRRFGISLPFELLAKKRGDVLLFANFLTQPSLFRAPVVVTIHDLCFVEHPEFVRGPNLFDLRRFVPQSLRRARLVLAVSRFTKASLINSFALAPGNIVVTPVPPLKTEVFPAAQANNITQKLGLTKPYILFIGTIEPRKNLGTLVAAYGALPSQLRAKYSLVLGGGKGWKNEDLLATISQQQQAGGDIILTGYISDQQKTALYQNATVVVLPSYYEGFGMPLLEAFQQHVPVIASNIPVLHEVAGSAALYFDPHKPAELAAAITKLLGDQSVRQKLVAKQPAELQKYSWADNAKQLFAKFQEIAK